MTTALHLCGSDDLAALSRLSERYHSETGQGIALVDLVAAIEPILTGSPLGVAYIAGPRTAPIGYIIVSFGWSVGRGGMTGTVDELWVRPSVRGRGLGTELLTEVCKALAGVGLKALSLSAASRDGGEGRLFARAGFAPQPDLTLLTRITR